MKITLLVIGKTDSSQLQELLEMYQNRLKHYVSFEVVVLPTLKKTKNMSVSQQKIKEGEMILNTLLPTDALYLLDEKGKQFTSVGFSEFLQKKMNASVRNLVIVIGGAFGFSEAVYQRAIGKISLSKMTFSHQMVRIFIAEQIYRAFTILRNEPYHNE
ncbi:MAG: 23S rRNA (pseudouridine(1915)-N(3))-methyltransferase RlmH [Flavobacteriaceae bacterium]|nr:23S rRNA (pseudouridine(1915)-N(3))-methyltransferase RlmH [Flavobacteriaceae bacterium]